MNTLFKITIVICLATTFVGCKNQGDLPANVLAKKELASVMIDLYLAEARLSGYPIQRDSSLKLFLPHESAILSKKNVPDSVLRNTYAYYLAHPDDFNDVYDVLIDSLTAMEKAKADESIKK
jgi:hypothetical protein